MFKKFHRFVRTIQESDDATKTRWVWGFSAGAMVLVFILWIGYIEVSTPASDTSTRAGRGGIFASVSATSSTPGFFETLSAGVGIVFDQAKKKLYHSRTETIRGDTSSIEVFKPIPPTKLP